MNCKIKIPAFRVGSLAAFALAALCIMPPRLSFCGGAIWPEACEWAFRSQKSFIARSAEEMRILMELPFPAEIVVGGEVIFDAQIKVRARRKILRGLPGAVLRNPNRTRENSGILYLKPGSGEVLIST